MGRILDLFRRDYADPGMLLTEDDFETIDLDEIDRSEPGFIARSSKSISACLDGLRGEREKRLAGIFAHKLDIARLEGELGEIDLSISAFEAGAEKLKSPATNVTPIRKGKMKEAAE